MQKTVQNSTQKALLTLLTQALWGNGGTLAEADWEQVEKLAKDQGVLSMLYKGSMKYKDIIPAGRIQIWRGAMYATVLHNDRMKQAQSEILGWLSEKGIRAVILKGTSVARYYNPSDMRYLGDIDLLVDRSDIDLAAGLLKAHGYRLNEHEHDFHVSFVREDVTLELHYKATVVPSGKGGQAVEKIMDRFLDEATMVSMNDISFPALSEKHQALMLLMHKERHMLEGGIGLRQLCDWAAFLSIQENSVTDDFIYMFKECGLLTFSEAVTNACVRYLGLQGASAAWHRPSDNSLVDALMEDVFRSGNMGQADQRGESELFVGREMLNGKKQTAVRNLILNLNKLAYSHFPVTRRCKWLLPVFWLYLPMRYLVRSLFGLRKKKNVVRMLKQSQKRFELHRRLHLYEVE